MALAPTLPWLFLGRLISGAAAGSMTAATAYMADISPPDKRADGFGKISAAISLGIVGGPALGGLMIAAFAIPHRGAGWVFALNSASFAGVIWVLVNWKRVPLFKSALPAERIEGSIRSGLRYVRYAPDLRASLVRAFVFTFFVSAIWSLLAVVARRDLKQGPLGYGILNGSLGVGAVVAAMTLHRLRQRFTSDQILAAATFYIHHLCITVSKRIFGNYFARCISTTVICQSQISA